MSVLSRDFYARPTLDVARALIGKVLVHDSPGGHASGVIVETEAYHQDDPASHSFRGLTPRTAPMFQAGGRLYVYFTYGMHYWLNIVTGPAGVGEGVLLRAAEPVDGIEQMKANRQVNDIRNLANGPGKLAQALGIFDTSLSGKILNKSSILLENGKDIAASDIVASPRIGITKATEQPWRFYVRRSPFVSKIRYNN